MKILHVIPTYLPAPEATGPIAAMHTLNKELVHQGVDVTVFTTNRDVPHTMTESVIDGVKVRYFKVIFKPWQYSREFHKALRDNIKEFDAVHVSSMFLSFLTLVSYYAKKHKVPYIVAPHGMLMKEPLGSKTFKKQLYFSLIERKNLERASLVLFTSEMEKAESLLVGIKFKETQVLPLGVSFHVTEPPNFLFKATFKIPESTKIVFFLGRLNWIKGLDTLTQAFAQVLKSKSNVMLVLAGPDQGCKSEVEKLANEFGISGNIIFPGELEGELKDAAFKESNLFALISYSENFSVVAAEAMAWGLPVVTTSGVGISPLIEKYKAGIIVNKNTDEVAQAMLEILIDQNKGEDMGRAGKALVRHEFAPEVIAGKMKVVYEQVRVGSGQIGKNKVE